MIGNFWDFPHMLSGNVFDSAYMSFGYSMDFSNVFRCNFVYSLYMVIRYFLMMVQLFSQVSWNDDI